MNVSRKDDSLNQRQRTREQVVVLAYLVILATVVGSARLGMFPGMGEAFEGSLLDHPYRLSMAVVVSILALLLGVASGWIGIGRRSLGCGVGVLVAGGFVTGVALSFNPFILYPNDQYPVTFGWLTAGAPLTGVTWLVTTLVLRRAGERSPV